MSKKIIKFLGIVIFSLFLLTPVIMTADSPQLNIQNNSGDYIYVNVYENGRWVIYVYESDGVTLVTVIEEEW